MWTAKAHAVGVNNKMENEYDREQRKRLKWRKHARMMDIDEDKHVKRMLKRRQQSKNQKPISTPMERARMQMAEERINRI